MTRRVALVVAAAWFMQNLDTSIITTSLPSIAATFGVGTVSVNLGITAYVVAGAALVPLGGWLSDRYGARTVFATAIVVFGLASVACAASGQLWVFVLARVAQGVAAALMTPVGRIVVLRNTAKDDLLRMTALITWPGLVAPVIGPVLGGALTTWFGWQWNFLLNVPLAVVGAVLVLVYVPNHREPDPRPLDRLGTVLMVATLGLGIYGLSELTRPTVAAFGFLTAGVLLGAAAVWWFRRAAHPLVDLAPLRVRTFATATLDAGTLVRLAISATPFLLPLMLQVVWHLDPLEAGAVLLTYALGNLVLKTVTTPVLRRLGFRTTLVGNGVLVALSIGACCLLDADTGTAVVHVVAFVAGATRSLQFTGLNTLTFADVDEHDQAAASTFFSMTQQVSMALGVAVAAILLGVTPSPLTQVDFTVAFAVTAAVALVGALLMLRLPRDAGQAVTGHQPRRVRSAARGHQ